MKYLFLLPVAWAVFWAISKMYTANKVLSKVVDGARKRQPGTDRREAAYRTALKAILADLLALERITPAQAEAWADLPLDKAEEQLLARGAVTLEQWDQLYTRYVLPALKEAEQPLVTLDPELQDELRQQRQKKER